MEKGRHDKGILGRYVKETVSVSKHIRMKRDTKTEQSKFSSGHNSQDKRGNFKKEGSPNPLAKSTSKKLLQGKLQKPTNGPLHIRNAIESKEKAQKATENNKAKYFQNNIDVEAENKLLDDEDWMQHRGFHHVEYSKLKNIYEIFRKSPGSKEKLEILGKSAGSKEKLDNSEMLIHNSDRSHTSLFLEPDKRTSIRSKHLSNSDDEKYKTGMSGVKQFTSTGNYSRYNEKPLRKHHTSLVPDLKDNCGENSCDDFIQIMPFRRRRFRSNNNLHLQSEASGSVAYSYASRVNQVKKKSKNAPLKKESNKQPLNVVEYYLQKYENSENSSEISKVLSETSLLLGCSSGPSLSKGSFTQKKI